MTIQISYYYTDYTMSYCEIKYKSIWFKEYRKHNMLHRLDGPVREFTNGSKEYWVENKLHRLDGPAIEYGDGFEPSKEYYVNDVNVTDKVKDLKEEDILRYLKVLSI